MAADRKSSIENGSHLWLGVLLFPRNISLERETEAYKNVDRWAWEKRPLRIGPWKVGTLILSEDFLLKSDTLY